MKTAVLLFAVARQLAGRDRLEMDLPAGATVADVRERLRREVPGLAGLADRLTFAIDTRYAADDAEIPEDSEIACIPPVSGG